MISFDQSICTDLRAATSREWLETNGIGGFASSTVAGLNTRRYHGLLVAATQPPVGRMVLVSKLEETLVISKRRVDLSANRYAGAIHPSGFEQLVGFRLDPWPIYTYEVDGVRIEKSVFMVHGSNTTVVMYSALSPKAGVNLRLEVRPLIAGRDYHSLSHENGAIRGTFERAADSVLLRPYDGVPDIHIAHNAVAIAEQGYWYRQFLYSVEQDRGLDATEDLFNPLLLEFDLTKAPAQLILSTEKQEIASVPRLARKERERRTDIVDAPPTRDEFTRELIAAADQFVVRRGNGHTLIAGYPWFTDWGRDTMISLTGLTISTRRFDVARDILRTFAEHVDEGMLPNLFRDDGSTADYNTVDATLWYFEAARAYVEATGDYNFVRILYPTLNSIIDWHVRGTRYDIHVLDNGLLNAGVPGVQLTWMDAKVGDTVITPRSGKPVEIQALWYNALRIMEEFAVRFGDVTLQRRYDDLASRCQWSFNRLFWNESAGCLYDVVNGGPPDASIRPNQIFAVSLPFSMLPEDKARSLVELVERELLTPVGLRTLARGDRNYRPRYEGGPWERDSAYHQGTVWPWLLGPFVTAYLKVHGNSAETRTRCAKFLEPLQAHLRDAGLGQISEIFDADAPHNPRGCFAQAWSVAEILKAQIAVEKPAIRRRVTRSRTASAAAGISAS